MIKQEEKMVMRAIALCFKPYLKQEEAMIYCNLERTQFAVRTEEMGIYKNEKGYYKKEDLDRMCTGNFNMEERNKRFLSLQKMNHKLNE